MDNLPVDLEADVKKTIISIYQKLGDATSFRDYLTDEVYAAELNRMEKELRAGKPVHFGKCCCENQGDAKRTEPYEIEAKPSCYKCLKSYFSNERTDFLGWGISGLFEQPTSAEESSDSTSTDEDETVERRLSDTRHKILRKLRRKNPEAFEINYMRTKADDIIKFENEKSVMWRNGTKVKRLPDKEIVKKNRRLKSVPVKRIHSIEYNIYGGGTFDFSNELMLREIYSSRKFEFLTGVIHYYQKFLKKHPEESYPSVSEIMMKSGQNICKDEEDVVARYYDVLHKKGGQKKNPSIIDNYKNESSQKAPKDLITEHSSNEKSKNQKEIELISFEDMIRARKTGILDLSCRSIVEIPEEIWTIDEGTSESKLFPGNKKQQNSNPSPLKRFKGNKTLMYLNLGHNKIKHFSPKGNCIDSLTHLVLTGNYLDTLPEEFGNFKSLQLLDLENNHLSSLPDSFCGLISLKELNIRRNFLTELPSRLGQLKKLTSIDLRWNKLRKLPETFEDLESLGNLNVAYNKITYLPLDMNNLFKLIILDVSYNKITEIPMLTDMPKLLLVNAMGNLIKEFPNFANSKSLCEIRLDGNRIKYLSTDHLENCPIVQLTLSHNKIVSIPDDFCTLETLVMLDCTNNRLSCLPVSLGRLKYLTCLRVEENHIEDLSKDILEGGSKKILEKLRCDLLMYEGNNEVVLKAKSELEILYIKGETGTITDNRRNMTLDPLEVAKTRSIIKKRLELENLPNEWIKIGQKCKVTTVDISNNKFRFIPPGLKSINTLKELIIRENNVKTVPDFIGRMPQLIELDLSFNCLDNFPLSMTTCRLTKLICRRNLFSTIPKVVFMIHTIEHLDFSENNLKEIDVDGLRNLRKLSYLNLSKNEIKKLPSLLGYMVNLRQLNVSDNLFKRPNSQVIRGGTQVILDYLKRHPDE